MGTGSVENLGLKWSGRLPTVPVPIFGRAIGACRENGGHREMKGIAAMKSLFAFTASLALALAPLGAELAAADDTASGEIAEKDVRAAIREFLETPWTGRPSQSRRTIHTFAGQSKEVLVITCDTTFSWFGDLGQPYRGVLFDAYVAGNVRSQLDSGIKGDDPYSGLIQVFRVYRHLRAESPDYRVPELEKLLALHRKGKLYRAVRDLHHYPWPPSQSTRNGKNKPDRNNK